MVTTTKTGIVMVLIKGGEFMMGSSKYSNDEQPVRKVRVDSFWMDRFEVTQKAYNAITGKNPSKTRDPDFPVEQVSWYDAITYCNMRSIREGLKPCYNLETLECDFDADGYRLPTEAEWEYACRAGSSSEFTFGDKEDDLYRYGWYKRNSGGTPHKVGQLSPNAFGLYDMHGNVWEWCNDIYTNQYIADELVNPRGPKSGNKRVLRGGSWNSESMECRAAARHSENAKFADVCFGADAYGFRCVRKANGADDKKNN
jgi:formylglycine-generating enzyme required for sulfatase activity